MRHTTEYLEYLQSDEWQQKREEKLTACPDCQKNYDIRYKDDGTPVQMCDGPLHVHHKSYDRLGQEEMYDLEVLCEYHHKELHRRQKAYREYKRRNAGMNTYAIKKYGEGWKNWMNPKMVAEEFNDWKKRQ